MYFAAKYDQNSSDDTAQKMKFSISISLIENFSYSVISIAFRKVFMAINPSSF